MGQGAAYSTKFDEAVALAVSAFRPVSRKSTGVPYITHLFAVTAIVGEYGGDEGQMIAALLHDYLEDIHGSSEEQLRVQFGDRVADMVVALSDTVVRPKPPWKDRKEKYLAVLADKHPDVKLISAADKLHNCGSIRRDLAENGPIIFERFRGRRDGTLWYYRRCVELLGDGWQHPLLEVLKVSVDGLLEEAG